MKAEACDRCAEGDTTAAAAAAAAAAATYATASLQGAAKK